MNKKHKLLKSIRELDNAVTNRKLRRMERKWIEDNPKINAVNYLFYRYFTNEFERYLIEKKLV